MSQNILEKFEKVKAFIFDVDGVMTDGSLHVTTAGEQHRTFFVKDGLAIVMAIKAGYPVAIISAGNDEGVRKRLQYLGVEHIFLGVKNKLEKLEELITIYNITLEDILYMGDDLPDIKVLTRVGLPTCPADAVNDVIPLCEFIASKNGGQGAVREVIEKVMKIQGTWKIPVD